MGEKFSVKELKNMWEELAERAKGKLVMNPATIILPARVYNLIKELAEVDGCTMAEEIDKLLFDN